MLGSSLESDSLASFSKASLLPTTLSCREENFKTIYKKCIPSKHIQSSFSASQVLLFLTVLASTSLSLTRVLGAMSLL